MAKSEQTPTASGQTTRTPSRELEQTLLAAADRVLARGGRSGLTVRAVATEAGVAPMGVYNRFGSKDGLLSAVLARGFDELRSAVTGDLPDEPVERLKASGRGYRRFALAQPDHYTAMFGADHTAGSPRDDLARHANAAFGALVDCVRYGMAGGALRPGDPDATAQLVWSAVHGAVSLELAGFSNSDEAERSYEALLVALVVGLG